MLNTLFHSYTVDLRAANTIKADPQALERNLRAISSPGSPRYGMHLKRVELEAIVAPSKTSKRAVHQWLKRSGVTDVEEEGQWMHFTALPSQANAMMDTDFLVYRHLSSGTAEGVRTTKVSLPRSVMGHIKMIHPTTRFTQIEAQGSTINHISEVMNTRIIELADNAPDRSCATTITPTCLRELYNIEGVAVSDPSKTGFIGVAGFLKQYARFSDLNKFTASQAPGAQDANFSWTGVNGTWR